jgi:hypothetical protein
MCVFTHLSGTVSYDQSEHNREVVHLRSLLVDPLETNDLLVAPTAPL